MDGVNDVGVLRFAEAEIMSGGERSPRPRMVLEACRVSKKSSVTRGKECYASKSG